MATRSLDDFITTPNARENQKTPRPFSENSSQKKRAHTFLSVTPRNLPPSYFVSATYDGGKRVACVKLYEPESEKIYVWYDATGHQPYCLTNLTPSELEKIDRLTAHPGFDHLERVEKYDPLLDRRVILTKVVARDPLAIGGRPRGCIRDIIPEEYPKIVGIEQPVKVWEAAIKYYECYIYDRDLAPGMIYRIENGELLRVRHDPSEQAVEKIRRLFRNEPKEFLHHIEAWARLLECPVPKFRRVALDIEVASPIATRVPDPSEVAYPVICVALLGSDGKRRVLLLRREGIREGAEKLPNVSVEYYDSEEELILEVFGALWDYPFVITFNGDDFDLRYLRNRAQKLGFRRDEIPIEVGRRICLLKYGVHIDLYKFFFNRSLQIYAFGQKYRGVTLDEVGEALVGMLKLELTKPVSELTYTELAKYCVQDAEITLTLTTFNDALVMKLILALARISSMPMEDVSRQGVSRWIRSFLHHEHRRRNMLIPNTEDILALKGVTATKAIIKGKKYKGAMVVCVHPKTLVILPEGRIEEIGRVQGTAVKCLDFADMKIKDGVVKRAARKSDDHLLKITTSSSFITCSTDHRFLTPHGWVPAKELKKGTLVAIANKIRFKGKEQKLITDNIDENILIPVTLTLRSYLRSKRLELGIGVRQAKRAHLPIDKIEYGLRRNVTKKTLKKILALYKLSYNDIPETPQFPYLPSTLTEDFSQALGYIAGDGHIKGRGIEIADKDHSLLSTYGKLIRKLFNKTPSIRYIKSKNMYRLRVNSKALVNFVLRNFPELREHSKERGVPELVCKSPLNHVSKFISGLFDAEGSFNKTNIETSSTSEKLMQQVQLLLTRFGIVSKIYPKARKNKTSYILTITDRDSVLKFQKITSIYSSNKKKKLEEVVDTLSHRKHHCEIPTSFDEKKLRVIFRDLRIRHRYFPDVEFVEGNVSRRLIEKFHDFLQAYLSSVKKSNDVLVIREKTGLSWEELARRVKVSPSCLWRALHGDKCLSKRKLDAAVKLVLKERKLWISKCKIVIKEIERELSDARWEHVKKVEEIKKDTQLLYDFHSPQFSNYIANGFIVHNSPTPGVHFNVAVMDFSSLYPSIIKVHNLGYQSILCPHEECKDNKVPDTPHWICKKQRALESLLIGSLRDLRVKWYKPKSKDGTLPSDLRNWYDVIQSALKVILNASVDYNEPIVLKDPDGKIKFMQIGEFVDECIENGSLIFDGINTITKPQKGWEALCFNPETKHVNFARVTHAIRHENLNQELLEITLRSGRKVRVTPDHSVFTLDKETWTIAPAEVADLRKGDYLIIPLFTPSFRADTNCINLIKEFGKLPPELTNDIAVFIYDKLPIDQRKTQLRILKALATGEMKNIRQIARDTGFEARCVSKNLRLLREKGYVTTPIERRNLKVYRATSKGMQNIQLEQILSTRLVRKKGKHGHCHIWLKDLSPVIDKIDESVASTWKIGLYGIGKSKHKVNAIIPLTNELSRLLGYYVSEGHSRSFKNKAGGTTYTATITNYDERILEDAEKCVMKAFNVKARRSKRGKDAVINSKIVYLLFINVLKLGADAGNKQIPHIIMTGENENKGAFLKAYYLGDGTKRQNEIKLTSKSPTLINQLSFLLMQFGVKGIYLTQDDGVHRLWIRDTTPFIEQKARRRGYAYVVPNQYVADIARRLRKFPYVYKDGKNISRNRAATLLQEYITKFGNSEHIRRLKSFLEGNLGLDKIKEIKKVKSSAAYVYDLSVEGAENFIGGYGLICLHNSYGVFGAEAFDLYCPPVAEATAAIGRYAITQTIERAQELGIQVLYGDTDSVFLRGPSSDQVESLTEWSEKDLGMDLDLDKAYRYSVFSSRKKNYLGVFPDGSVEVKGLTGKKRHVPAFLKEAFRQMVERLGKVKSPAEFEEAKREIRRIVRNCYLKLKQREYPLDKLAFHVVLGKMPRGYVKTTPQHVKAALELQKRGMEIKAGDLISFVKVTKEPHVKPIQVASKSEVDVDKYVGYLHSTFDQVLDALGLDFDEIIGLTKLERWI